MNITDKQVAQALKDAERLVKSGIALTNAEKNLLRYLASK
jgi:hypothetical protein